MEFNINMFSNVEMQFEKFIISQNINEREKHDFLIKQKSLLEKDIIILHNECLELEKNNIPYKEHIKTEIKKINDLYASILI
jgi:hypothetical protein